MTGNKLERGMIVDDVMLEAGIHEAPELKTALHSLGAFASMQAPEPSPELAALFAATTDKPSPTDELSKRRWMRTHRPAVLGIAVVTAMGLGVSGVAAASSGFTKQPEFMNRLLAGWAPGWTSPPPSLQPQLPTPDAPKITSVPAPTVDPAAVPPVENLAPQAPAAPAPAPEQQQAAIPAVPAAPNKGSGTTAMPAVPAVPAAPQKDAVPVPKPPAANTKLKTDDLWQLLERDRRIAGSPLVNYTLKWWIKDAKDLKHLQR